MKNFKTTMLKNTCKSLRLNTNYFNIKSIQNINKYSFSSNDGVHKWGQNLQADVEQFKINSKTTIDYIVEKTKEIDSLPITKKLEPGFLDELIPQNAPEEGKRFEEVLKDIDEKIINNYTHYTHKNFHADVCLNSYPAVIGNFISDAFNTPGVSWVANPAGFELERIVLDWLAEEFNLPENFRKTESGCCVHLDSGESGAVIALAARTKKRLEYKNQDERFTYYYSTEANKAAKKSTYIAHAQAKEIPVVWDEVKQNFVMDVEILKKTIEQDIKDGLIPTMVYASMGNYNTTAMDDISAISSLCEKHKIWCHVDASVLGNVLMLEEKQKYLKGLEKANSIIIEGNKALPFGMDSGFFWVDEAKYVFKALNEDFVLYVQLFKDNQAEMTNYHFGTARATKSIRLWMVIKAFGMDGLKALLRKQIKHINLLELKLKGDGSRFKILTKAKLNTLTFTLKKKSNRELRDFITYINDSDKMLISLGELRTQSEKINYGRICLNDIYMKEERIDEIVGTLNKLYSEYFK